MKVISLGGKGWITVSQLDELKKAMGGFEISKYLVREGIKVIPDEMAMDYIMQSKGDNNVTDKTANQRR